MPPRFRILLIFSLLCLALVGYGLSGGEKPETKVTYSKDVARVVQEHCQECHRPGQVAPFAMMDFNDVKAWSETIREVVKDGRMPPWHADPAVGKFANDRRLPVEAKQTLLKWIDQGTPRGDDKDLPAKKIWPEGWRIGKPDAVFTMKETFEVPAVAPGGVEYQYFEVETGFTEDKWVSAAEAKAGASAVVHHILVFIATKEKPFHQEGPGNAVLCGVAPGDIAMQFPPGFAKRIPAGSKLIFQMHYTPNGKAIKDQSSVGLIFQKEKPEREAHTTGVYNVHFRIPAGADNHRVEVPSAEWQAQLPLLAAQSVASPLSPGLLAGLNPLDSVRRYAYTSMAEGPFTFPKDGYILGFLPHMHLRGKSFRYEVVHADGKVEVLLIVPRYRFDWQTSYRLAEPYRVKKGAMVRCVAYFDNSAKNLSNPDPKKDVFWGDQTWEEMMIGFMEYGLDR